MSLQDGSEPHERKWRRVIGLTVRAPGVSVSLDKETVGELTRRYIDDEHRSQRRSAFLEGFVSIAGLLLGAIATAVGILPLGHNAVALVASLVGIFAMGILTAAWSIASSVQRQARSREEQQVPRSLLALRQQLGEMRQPLLNRSFGLSAPEKEH